MYDHEGTSDVVDVVGVKDFIMDVPVFSCNHSTFRLCWSNSLPKVIN